jgi:hypothetical protein
VPPLWVDLEEGGAPSESCSRPLGTLLQARALADLEYGQLAEDCVESRQAGYPLHALNRPTHLTLDKDESSSGALQFPYHYVDD